MQITSGLARPAKLTTSLTASDLSMGVTAGGDGAGAGGAVGAQPPQNRRAPPRYSARVPTLKAFGPDAPLYPSLFGVE